LSCAQLLTHAGAVARLLSWSRRALADAHLVTVAHALHRSLRAGIDDLRTLRLPVDLLKEFPGWRFGSRAGFRPPVLGLKPRPAGAGYPLGSLRLQLSPTSGMVPLALTLLRDLLRRLDPGVRIVVFVEPESDLQRVQRLAHAFGAGDDRRVRFVKVRSSTLYAQDSARAAVDAHGFPALLLPRGFRPELGRDEDSVAVDEAQRALGVRIVRSRTYWEGGNVINDEDRCVVGADTIAENRARLGLTEREVRRLLAADLGAEVQVLGDVAHARFDTAHDEMAPSGQATFHIDLDVALLGQFGPRRSRPVALLSDPERGLRWMDRVLAHRPVFARHLVPARRARALLAEELESSARERQPVLTRYRQTLEHLGYRVVGVPDLRLLGKDGALGATRLDLSYCNVLPGLRRGRPSVHYLPWGIRALDREAEARFRSAGVDPVRVTADPVIADSLMQAAAGLHCFCGPLP
jgi:hypothetical protein